jgi:hypothetical protein
MTRVVATTPMEHVFNNKNALLRIDGGFDLVPYPGWRWVPMFDGSLKHEKIEDAVAAPVDSRPVDADLLREIRNIAIEDCARILEQEAAYNDKVASDEKDSIYARYRAATAADNKRTCAAILRGLKK